MNNPLKYVDNSGHVVEMYGYDVVGLGFIAPYEWLGMNANSPDLTCMWITWNFYEEAHPVQSGILVNSPETYTIQFGATSEPGYAAETRDDKDIVISNSYENDPYQSAAYLAHEAVHTQITGPNSIFEETLANQHMAHQYQYYVNQGYKTPQGGSYQGYVASLKIFTDVRIAPLSTITLTKQLEDVRDYFVRESNNPIHSDATRAVYREYFELKLLLPLCVTFP